jgi:hypothetical protein
MKLPLKIALALKALTQGETIPQSQLKGPLIDGMISEGIILRKLQGRTKSALYVNDVNALTGYVQNHFGIADLSDYITGYSNEELSRSQAIEIASDSKFKSIRTFKGFLVNCYAPIRSTLNNQPLVINPATGTFAFIYDFENFIPPPQVTIVGIENPENFRHIEKQQSYFKNIQPLFVSRYPQSKDLVKWLINLPNPYLHFGDFDFEGVNIYLNEYKKHLGNKASFFIPDNLAQLLSAYGNAALYNKQFKRGPNPELIEEKNIKALLSLLHAHKKVLEQEILIQL